ncbi:MAG: polymer-forming cytoskeletal protein [Thermaurantimonas sp.]
MIFKKKSKPIAISNRILQGTIVNGTIESEGDLRIDGEIQGEITIKGKLVIGVEGKIVGNVKCTSSKIEGKLIGDITAAEAVHMITQSYVEGNVITNRLIVDEGSVFNGRCRMTTGEKLNKKSDPEKINA